MRKLLFHTYQEEIEKENSYKAMLSYFKWFLVVSAILGLIFSCKLAHASEIKASWYSIESLKKEGTWKTSKGVMANGEAFKEEEFTCATRLWKLGTYLQITKGNLSVIVKVTDRIGKRFAKKRIDLSKSAFQQITDLKEGLISVEVRKL